MNPFAAAPSEKERQIGEYVERKIADAIKAFHDRYFRWPSMWLMAYYDPSISHEENCALAEMAVAGGWTPDKITAA